MSSAADGRDALGPGVRDGLGLRARSLRAAVLTVLLVALACLAASAPAGARPVSVDISLYRNPGACLLYTSPSPRD